MIEDEMATHALVENPLQDEAGH